jgi:hypothetical protein
MPVTPSTKPATTNVVATTLVCMAKVEIIGMVFGMSCRRFSVAAAASTMRKIHTVT